MNHATALIKMERDPPGPGRLGSVARTLLAAAGAYLWLLAAPLLGDDEGLVFDLKVSAGKHARNDTLVSADLPEGIRAVRLVETTGGVSKVIPSQVEPGSPPRLYWILSGKTLAGSRRTFRGFSVPSASQKSSAGVSIHDEKGKYFELRLGGKKVLRYNYGMVTPPDPDISRVQTRNAYIHPVWTPSGGMVTNDFPRQHPHQRGLWFPWARTEFEGRYPDFWNVGKRTGTVRFHRTEATFSGPLFGGFRVRHRHVDLSAPGGEKVVLKELWEVKVYALGGEKETYFLFDLLSVQECAGRSFLGLPKYRYGGLGFRGSLEWEGQKVKFLTSEGKTRKDGHGTRARWCDISGLLGESHGGIVIYCYPGNYRFPQHMRIHPTEPFFNFAPVQGGYMQIRPGRPYISRYRFLVHDGRVPVEEVERIWRDYAEPPRVVLEH